MQLNKPHYQIRRLFTITCLLLFNAVSFLQGQGNDVLECPYFTIESEDTSGVAFALLSTDVDATVSGVIAKVQVQQTYFNPGKVPVNATYVFPMSSKAAVYDMRMIVNDRTIQAVIKRKEEAQEIYDNAKEDGLTTSLLEQERPNVFQMSLANINPGDTVRIEMLYTELLEPTNGVYQFVFPSIVGPRFTTGGESWVNQAIQDSFAVARTALNIDLKINAGMPVEASSKSHNVTFERSTFSTQTTLSTQPGDDFIVDYTLDDNSIETGLLLYEGEEENFFLSMIQPTRPDVPYFPPPREYIFIMDVSGSMRGEPIEVSKWLISNLLTDLNPEDKFNIVFFASSSATFAPNSLPVTDENIGMALQMIDDITGGGGTRLLPAMEKALEMGGTEDYSRTFVILTDGYVTVEKEAFELIRNNLNEANFFAFGIGRSVNRYIIEGMAYVGEGEAFVATDFADANTMAATFKSYIEKPVLTNIEALFSGIDVYDVEPLTIPDVFAERPIIIYGKYNKPANGTITLTGDYGGGLISNTLSFQDYTTDVEENIALKYLWARKKIRLMSDYGIASNESDTLSIEEEITRLGLKYNLVTEYTSFVAVDSNAVSDPGGIAGNDSENDDTRFGGTTTDINTLPFSANAKKEILKILGTVRSSDGKLSIQLEGIQALNADELTIRIFSLNGQLLQTFPIDPLNREETINLLINQLPVGLYTLSLFSNGEVLDSEGFIVVK
ncbi:MAG: VIT domain-containing protein [Bacteroidota bacterium]